MDKLGESHSWKDRVLQAFRNILLLWMFGLNLKRERFRENLGYYKLELYQQIIVQTFFSVYLVKHSDCCVPHISTMEISAFFRVYYGFHIIFRINSDYIPT